MVLKIKVLYEDPNILVIDKPEGLAVHSDGRTKEKTVADWILKHYPRMKNVGEQTEGIARPGIVHRLDRDTSGVLVLVKNQKTFLFLKNQFMNREVKKIYHAIVSGSMKEEHGFIKKPIGRSPKDFRKYLAGRGAKGELKDAETFYKVLKKLEFSNIKYSYLEVRPKTGRTHQIRVHMKYLNHPVVGDPLYNPDGPHPRGFKRMALHAFSIEFKDLKGKILKIESKLPKEFQSMLK